MVYVVSNVYYLLRLFSLLVTVFMYNYPPCVSTIPQDKVFIFCFFIGNEQFYQFKALLCPILNK